MEHKLESRPVPIPSRASPDRSRGGGAEWKILSPRLLSSGRRNPTRPALNYTESMIRLKSNIHRPSGGVWPRTSSEIALNTQRSIWDYPELSVGSGANGLENATSWSGATWDRLNGPRTLLSRYTYREGRVTRSSCRFVREVQLGLKIENFHFCFNEGL